MHCIRVMCGVGGCIEIVSQPSISRAATHQPIPHPPPPTHTHTKKQTHTHTNQPTPTAKQTTPQRPTTQTQTKTRTGNSSPSDRWWISWEMLNLRKVNMTRSATLSAPECRSCSPGAKCTLPLSCGFGLVVGGCGSGWVGGMGVGFGLLVAGCGCE